MKFVLEIITPERKAFSEEVDMVTVPTTDGIIGIMARHVPLFTSLQEGEVKIKIGSNEYFLAIGGGFMQVLKNKVIILVSRAVHAEELNEEEIRKAELEAKDAIGKAGKASERNAAQSVLRRTLLDMKVVRRRRNTNPLIH
jgi:F-type H+-transporting ATPase subunit epsilon